MIVKQKTEPRFEDFTSTVNDILLGYYEMDGLTVI